MVDNILPQDQEIWLPVVGYEGLYEVSRLGNVRRIIAMGYKDKYKALSLVKTYLTRGYLYITLMHPHPSGIGRNYSWRTQSHRLVATAFIPNPDNKPEVNHINGVRDDNRLENLEWMTHKENLQHSVDVLGKKRHGEYNGRALFTDDQIREIRKLYATGKYTQQAIGDMYAVSNRVICFITRGETWKHVK